MVVCDGETNQMYERQMKYVAASVTHPGREKEVEHIFIFPEFINHNQFADTMQRMRDSSSYGNEQLLDFRIVGAGFTDGNQCWGRSETLHCDSRGAIDAQLIPHVKDDE